MPHPPGQIKPEDARAVRSAARASERARTESEKRQLALYKAIRKAARAGAPINAIAAESGLTKQRISQIVRGVR